MYDEKILYLRGIITASLGEYRSRHVLSTEEEAVRLAAVYLPSKEREVRISALLHDITKEYDVNAQLQTLKDFGMVADDVLLNSPKVLHSVTAPFIIKRDFSEFASDEVISAVRNHTTGAADMSLLDCIIYLADYIEPLRSFEDCKKLREYFWSGIDACSSEKEKLLHLYKTMVMSFDMTIENLIDEHCVISPDTFSARNAFLMKISEGNNNE